MRDILFKAKRTDNGEWVEGYLLKYSPIYEEKTYILPFNSVCVSDIEVKPETVCQYTGLKDESGQKVFEGDILDVIYSDQQGESHHTENYVLDDLRTTSVIGWLDYANELKVVGNIFDNAELVE